VPTDEGDEGTTKSRELPQVVRSIRQAASKEVKSPRLWTNLAEQAILSRHQLRPLHIAEILRSFARIGYRNEKVVKSFCDQLLTHSDVKSMVIALVSLHKLKLPFREMQASLMRNIAGNTDGFSFSDLKHVLLALARLEIDSPAFTSEVCESIMNAIREKDRHVPVDPKQKWKSQADHVGVEARELLVLPYCLGKLRFTENEELCQYLVVRIRSLIQSRLRCLPLDAVQAFYGFLLMGPQFKVVAGKCGLYCRFIFERLMTPDLVLLAPSFKTLGIDREEVWHVWADAMQERTRELSVDQLVSLVGIFQSLGRPAGELLFLIDKKREERERERERETETAEAPESERTGAQPGGGEDRQGSASTASGKTADVRAGFSSASCSGSSTVAQEAPASEKDPARGRRTRKADRTVRNHLDPFVCDTEGDQKENDSSRLKQKNSDENSVPTGESPGRPGGLRVSVKESRSAVATQL